MSRLNAVAAEVARAAGASAATDVTGFGLLGHLHKLALASGLRAVVEAGAVPVLPGVPELLAAGFVPGGTVRNLDFVRPHLSGAPLEGTLTLLADAQTSGGLLFACPPAAAAAAVERLTGTGHAAAVIGALTAGPPGKIEVVA